VVLDADAPRLWGTGASLPSVSQPLSATSGERGKFTIEGLDIAFVLSDDQPLSDLIQSNLLHRSLGDAWLQGHMAVGVCHFLLDEGVELNLSQE
jgi:hypothetical protein